MAVMWRCPECETMNTEDKCIICGCSKPKTINNTNRPNIVQEQLKISNSNQESLKSVQNSNQYIIDNQQDSINSAKTHTSNRKKKNKKIPIIIVSCVTVIFIACVSLGVIKNYVDITDKREAGLPDVATPATAISLTQITTVETTAPVSEEKTTTTVVPESVTESVVEDDMVVMPSLVKQGFIEATKILDELGLQYKITYSDKKYVGVGENCVYSQNPATGKEIKRDTVVELGISTYQQATTKPTTVPQTTPPVTATRTKQITKDIEIPINNAKMTNGSWGQSISLEKTDFDCSCITPDTIVKVEFELGAPSSKKNAPVELILQNYTSDPQIWVKIEPFEYDYDKKSASFDYKSMVSSYGSDDFSTVDCLHIGDRGVYIKVTRLSITNCSVNSDYVTDKKPEAIVAADEDYITIKGKKYSTSLTKLKLDNMDLTNEDIKDLYKMINLTELHLRFNKISDLNVLKNLTNLTYLELWENQISDISALENLTNLIDLDLGENQISDISSLKNLTNLTNLGLSTNQIIDISVLKNLTNLSHLVLQDNQISDISSLKNLTNLTYLSLDSNQISDIKALESLTNLTELDLSYNQISYINALKDLINLNHLGLRKNQIGEKDIEDLKKALPNCDIRF